MACFNKSIKETRKCIVKKLPMKKTFLHLVPSVQVNLPWIYYMYWIWPNTANTKSTEWKGKTIKNNILDLGYFLHLDCGSFSPYFEISFLLSSHDQQNKFQIHFLLSPLP